MLIRNFKYRLDFNWSFYCHSHLQNCGCQHIPLFDMLTGCQILVCWIGRAVQWRLLQVALAAKMLILGNRTLIFMHGRATCFLASSWSASWPGALLKSAFDTFNVTPPLSSDNFDFFFLSSSCLSYLQLSEVPWFWFVFSQRKLAMGISSTLCCSGISSLFLLSKKLQQLTSSLNSNICLEFFCKISEESFMLSPN